MKALAVKPGIANSIHLRDVPKPTIGMIANGRGVLVKVLSVGMDGKNTCSMVLGPLRFL